MKLIERWHRFRARQPGPFYSYVWWETILSFYFTLGLLMCMALCVITWNWLFGLGMIAHVMLDYWWTMREIKGRKKYRRQST